MTNPSELLPAKGSFSLSTSIVGWDLDHTLARYSQESLSAHVVDCFARFIVNHAGYNPELHHLAQARADLTSSMFSSKGVVFDKLLGNFLWVNQDKKVTVAYHGTKLLFREAQKDSANQNRGQNGQNGGQNDQNEGQNDQNDVSDGASEKAKKEVKGEEEELQLTHIYAGPIDEFDVKAKEFHPRDRFHSFLTGFDFPILHLLACLVDLLDEGKAKEGGNQAVLPEPPAHLAAQPFDTPYAHAFIDLVRGFEFNFSHFTHTTGYYFPVLRENPSRFVYDRAHVREWILRLREHHVPLFLVTNADFGYCNLLMSVTYGRDWQTLFDLVVVSAKKPKFFSEENPFLEVDQETMLEGNPVAEIEFGKVYSQGNATGLAALLSKKVKPVPGEGSPRVVYFGDNLLTDVMAIKLHQDWLPVAISEEMEQHVVPENRAEKRGLKRKENGTAVEEEKTPSVEGNGNHHHLSLQTPSETWGSFFFTETEKVSYWARFIELHSALCISDVSVLTSIPIDHMFEYEFGTSQCYYPKLANGQHTPPSKLQ